MPPPMDMNDWLLAAATATAAAGIPVTAAHAANPTGDQVGIATAVRPGVVSASKERVVYIGNAVTFGERFKTDSTGTMHILFMDQSSMTLGPNSELVIDEFTFNPEAKRGNISVKFLQGALRVVGGFISKYTNARGRSSVQVNAPTATIGIRGGICLLEASQISTQATFLFGHSMEFSSLDGTLLQTVTRPGFSVSSGPNGVGDPTRVPTQQLSSGLTQFEGRTQQDSTSVDAWNKLASLLDRPDGLEGPQNMLAPDRVDISNLTVSGYLPGSSLRNMLGSQSTQVQS